MAINADVQVALLKTLNASARGAQGRVALLSGAWGSGKTYFWKEVVSPVLGRKSLYVSVFGVESAAQLKTRIVTRFLLQMGRESGPGWVREKSIKMMSWFSFKSRKKAAGATATVADALINHALSKFQVDILEAAEMIDKDVVICFDDVERLSERFKIEEFLGIVNALSEHRGIDVVLICNEDHLLSGNSGMVYSRYKEKTISTQHRIRSDLSRVFGDLVSQHDEGIRGLMARDELLVLDMLKMAGMGNIRTLKRALELLSIVHALAGVWPSDVQVAFLLALSIESAEGRIQEVEFYRFEEYATKLLKNMADKEGGGDQRNVERVKFIEKHGLAGKYVFSEPLYELVRYGRAEVQHLKLDLIPEVPVKGGVDSLFDELRNGAWKTYSDQQARDLSRRLLDAAVDDEGADVGRVLRCLMYSKYLAGIVEMSVDEGRLEAARARLLLLASGDGASMLEDFELTHGEVSGEVRRELELYREAVGSALGRSRVARFKALLEGGEYEELSRELWRGLDIARAVLEGGEMSVILLKARIDGDAVSTVVRSLLASLRTAAGVWPDSVRYYGELRGALERMSEDAEVGRMQRWRIAGVLKAVN